ncbi:MerR family transcriptional regulator [Cellulomonas phragmiteti]|uniref:Transcriptional regulator n=1 Tax=Cellulomonas phragmiteti TaxID=478780 RepID=A0ABQ4DIN8_9CELL|nr:MerR family transcriptional regulator [Cellulomonas phragmiteti]GIG39220.1 transcriptional regulator [Cellulomonas phragmiteti]
MLPSLVPPRHVTIDDAASFVGTTPQAIRRHHATGLLPEPEPGGDDRRYGHDEVVRLLWIRRMADAGISADRIGAALADPTPAGTGSRGRLLSDVVADRLESLPEGALRQADLDVLLVTEHIFGPLGAAIQAGRFIALAAHPELRAESDRLDAAEEALDDTVAVDDPRVARVAADRHAFELRLAAAIEDSGQGQRDDALIDSWEAEHTATADDGRNLAAPAACSVDGSTGVLEAVAMMPYDFSPARLRCMELTHELAVADAPPAP